MKIRTRYGSLALAAVLCLSFAACGSGGGNDSDTIDNNLSVTGYSDPVEGSADMELTGGEAPESFEGMVQDSLLLPDETVYLGTWLGEDQSQLIVEQSESGEELRFDLYDSGDQVTASGFIQYVPEYGCDYFYNEYDGVAYRSSMEDSGTLQIISLGTFTKVSGDAPGETVGDVGYDFLAGAWYLDGNADADSILEIDQLGNWTLYERPGGDGDPTEVDSGTIQPDPDGDGAYTAVSATFEDVAYDMTVIDGDVLYWGGENDYYQKLA